MKTFVILLIAAFLSACSSTSGKFEKRAEETYKRQTKETKQAIKEAPDWMTEVPEDPGAVYANGTAVSWDMNMADFKAMTMALGKICVAAGGTIDERSRIYMKDTPDGTLESSELAIQQKCHEVDVTGSEIADIKRVAEGARFRTYVLVALPIGDANQLAAKRRIRDEQVRLKEDMNKAFDDMEGNTQ